MKQVIIGYGEVGKALERVLEHVRVHDPMQNKTVSGLFDVLHISFPYFDGFIKAVLDYQKRFKSKLTIIHSTVPVGTCTLLGAVHSPIRGVHPHLETGIRTFVKYFGGKGAHEAAQIFKNKGIRVRIYDRAEDVEAGKLWSTTQYGISIMLNKEIKKWCDEHDVDFDIVYHEFNRTYNKGYLELGKKDVLRPILKYMEGPIGGHCVLQNAELIDSPSARYLTEANKEL